MLAPRLLNRPASQSPGRPVLDIAHRGASVDAPENTLAAVRLAVAQAADLVEVDVQLSRDGVPVLLHDATLARTTDVRTRFPDRAPWRVGDLTLGELRCLDAGSWHGTAYAGADVPTLAEVLDVLHRTGVGLLLELKAPEQHPGIVSRVVEELRGEAGVAVRAGGGVVVQSFHIASVKEAKTRMPELSVGILGSPARSHLPALASWADQVNPPYLRLDQGYVAAVHAHGMRCLTWTVDRRSSMRRAVRAGVDGVITNRPGALRSLLGHAPSAASAQSTRVGSWWPKGSAAL